MLPLFDDALATGAAWFGSWLPALRPTATQIAELAYVRRHICRLDPLPPAALGMMAAANPELYEAMWGPVECQPTGLLKDSDVTDRLHEIPGSGIGHLRSCRRSDPRAMQAPG